MSDPDVHRDFTTLNVVVVKKIVGRGKKAWAGGLLTSLRVGSDPTFWAKNGGGGLEFRI